MKKETIKATIDSEKLLKMWHELKEETTFYEYHLINEIMDVFLQFEENNNLMDKCEIETIYAFADEEERKKALDKVDEKNIDIELREKIEDLSTEVENLAESVWKKSYERFEEFEKELKTLKGDIDHVD